VLRLRKLPTPSLLDEAFQRAARVAPWERICSVVAERHRRWWSGRLPIRSENVIVQPENRGSAIGILLPLLHIIERDPRARVVLLPSDHYVRDEAVLARSLEHALAGLSAGAPSIVLLGLEPETSDPELGYIVPAAREEDGARRVARFVEKPAAAEAAVLIEGGALWNAFIIAAHAQALLDLYARRYPQIVTDLRSAAAFDARDRSGSDAIRGIYRLLPTIDFSRGLLEGGEPRLRVLAAPPCGWSDLGTPERVARTLRDTQVEGDFTRDQEFTRKGGLSLARQNSLVQGAAV
jgi:mannose-1-phosphate guanylyltransferase